MFGGVGEGMTMWDIWWDFRVKYKIYLQPVVSEYIADSLTRKSLADLGEKQGRVLPPPGPISIMFMKFLGENWPNNRLAPPPWGWRLPLPVWEILDPSLLAETNQDIISYHPSKEGDIIFISTSDVSCVILPEGKATSQVLINMISPDIKTDADDFILWLKLSI